MLSEGGIERRLNFNPHLLLDAYEAFLCLWFVWISKMLQPLKIMLHELEWLLWVWVRVVQEVLSTLKTLTVLYENEKQINWIIKFDWRLKRLLKSPIWRTLMPNFLLCIVGIWNIKHKSKHLPNTVNVSDYKELYGHFYLQPKKYVICWHIDK